MAQAAIMPPAPRVQVAWKANSDGGFTKGTDFSRLIVDGVDLTHAVTSIAINQDKGVTKVSLEMACNLSTLEVD